MSTRVIKLSDEASEATELIVSNIPIKKIVKTIKEGRYSTEITFDREPEEKDFVLIKTEPDSIPGFEGSAYSLLLFDGNSWTPLPSYLVYC